MRRFLPTLLTVATLSYGAMVSAESIPFTDNLSLGASGAQVTALQQLLNRDPDTRVANSGPGSPGQETGHYGQLTRAAIARFQEKYASDVLAPVGLVHGTGTVRAYTRAKLNALLGNATTTPVVSTSPSTATTSPIADYLVKDSERVDIYVGDKMIASTQNRIYDAISVGVEARIASRTAEPIVIPKITAADSPSVAIGNPTPRFGLPGTYISFKGTGISRNSVIYFGDSYIVRTVTENVSGNYSFIVPPIPPGRYDIAIKTGGTISNTTMFVVTNQKNPSVHLESASPSSIKYGDVLTIKGSGFSRENNVVVTTYQTISHLSSADGTTLAVPIAPVSLKEAAKIGNGKIKKPMSLYVVSDYGFSDSTKTFTMNL